MNQLLIYVLKRIWILFCAFATLLAVILQCYDYGKGQDVTQMEYKSFNENELDVYPSIGLCFTMAIKEEDLNIYRYNVTPLQYAEFLLGYHWDRNMMNIDYENVIQHLNEYILTYGYTGIHAEGRVEDVSLYSSQNIDSTKSKKMPGMKELGFAGVKCLTLDIPFQKDVLLDKFWLWVRPEIFLQGTRPSITIGHPLLENRFIVQPHYPKQCFKYITRGMKPWPHRDETASKSYIMRFYVGGIEVLERRNKYWKPCDIHFPDLDNQMQESVLEKIGCKPPYWNSSSLLPLCSDVEKMRNASELFGKIWVSNAKLGSILGSVPCRSLERITFDAKDVTIPNHIKENSYLNGSVGIYFDYKESNYKEVTHVRSMNGQDLIGNYTKIKIKCIRHDVIMNMVAEMYNIFYFPV